MVRWMRDTFELDQPHKQRKQNESNRKYFEQKSKIDPDK